MWFTCGLLPLMTAFHRLSWPTYLQIIGSVHEMSRACEQTELDGLLASKTTMCGMDSTSLLHVVLNGCILWCFSVLVNQVNATHSGHCATWRLSSPVSPPPCTGPGRSWWARRRATRASWRWRSPGAERRPTDAPNMDSRAHLERDSNSVRKWKTKAVGTFSAADAPSAASHLLHYCYPHNLTKDRHYSSSNSRPRKQFNSLREGATSLRCIADLSLGLFWVADKHICVFIYCSSLGKYKHRCSYLVSASFKPKQAEFTTDLLSRKAIPAGFYRVQLWSHSVEEWWVFSASTEDLPPDLHYWLSLQCVFSCVCLCAFVQKSKCQNHFQNSLFSARLHIRSAFCSLLPPFAEQFNQH